MRYIIVKNMTSRYRLERQRQTAAGAFLSPLRALYFGSSAKHEPFAMMHAELSEPQNGWKIQALRSRSCRKSLPSERK